MAKSRDCIACGKSFAPAVEAALTCRACAVGYGIEDHVSTRYWNGLPVTPLPQDPTLRKVALDAWCAKQDEAALRLRQLFDGAAKTLPENCVECREARRGANGPYMDGCHAHQVERMERVAAEVQMQWLTPPSIPPGYGAVSPEMAAASKLVAQKDAEIHEMRAALRRIRAWARGRGMPEATQLVEWIEKQPLATDDWNRKLVDAYEAEVTKPMLAKALPILADCAGRDPIVEKLCAEIRGFLAGPQEPKAPSVADKCLPTAFTGRLRHADLMPQLVGSLKLGYVNVACVRCGGKWPRAADVTEFCEGG